MKPNKNWPVVIIYGALISPPIWAQQQQQQQQQAQYQNQQPINVYGYVPQRQQQQQQQRQQQQQQQQQQWVQNQQQQNQQQQKQWQQHRQQSSTSNSTPTTAKAGASAERRPLRVEINGRKYGVTVDAKNRLTKAIQEYRSVNNIGVSVLGFAALLRLWDLWWVDANEVEQIDSLLKVVFDDPPGSTGSDAPDGVITLLSAPSTWSKTSRDTFARLLQYEAINAANRGEHEEQHMWLHLRDIILNYERYEDGGIRVERDGLKKEALAAPTKLLDGTNTVKLKLRALTGEQYRSIAGLSGPFNWQDQDQLAKLISTISNYTAASDYIATADFPFYLDFSKRKLPPISQRDLMLLNKALLTLDDQARTQLRIVFNQFANQPSFNNELWQTLAKYTEGEHWHGLLPGQPLNSEQDELGFWDDTEYIKARHQDLAFYDSFYVPTYYWSGPAPFGPYVYFWSSPQHPPSRTWTFYFGPK